MVTMVYYGQQTSVWRVLHTHEKSPACSEMTIQRSQNPLGREMVRPSASAHQRNSCFTPYAACGPADALSASDCTSEMRTASPPICHLESRQGGHIALPWILGIRRSSSALPVRFDYSSLRSVPLHHPDDGPPRVVVLRCVRCRRSHTHEPIQGLRPLPIDTGRGADRRWRRSTLSN